MAVPVKYLAGASTGVAFNQGEIRSVVVTNEAVNPTQGYHGDTITYTATVKDNTGAALPAAFKVDLLYNGAKVGEGKALSSDVYNPETCALTLAWTVPAWVGKQTFTVKLSWSEQYI